MRRHRIRDAHASAKGRNGTRGTASFLLGASSVRFAERVRRISAESERFWELSSDLLCTAGADGHLKRLNPAWERTLGWTPEELRARPFPRVRAPRRPPADRGRGGHYRHKSGGYRTLFWGATAIPEEGLIYAIACFPGPRGEGC